MMTILEGSGPNTYFAQQERTEFYLLKDREIQLLLHLLFTFLLLLGPVFGLKQGEQRVNLVLVLLLGEAVMKITRFHVFPTFRVQLSSVFSWGLAKVRWNQASQSRSERL